MECAQQNRINTESIIIQRTFDASWMDQLVRQPEIWQAVSDDASPRAEAFTVAIWVQDVRHVFLEVVKAGQPCGFFMFLRRTDCVYEAHVVLNRDCRGHCAIAAGRLACDWMFANTDCLLLLAFCRDNAPQTLPLAQHCGFRIMGRKNLSHYKDGQAQGTTYVYCVKGDSPCP